MKVGIMGGTFDPIHIGHLIAAEAAREGMRLDEVWFMPSNVPPHKYTQQGASVSERIEMVRKAIEGHPYFRLQDLEIQRGGTSYSIDTVKELERLHPANCYYYIIGADMVHHLPHWYQIDELVRHVAFLGLQRTGFSSDLSGLSSHIRDKVTWVPMPVIEISSTQIRERRRHNKSLRYLVPDSVLKYMEGNGLYES